MNTFKGLDMTDRVPEEICTEVHNIVQEVMTKPIPKKKNWKKAKWVSEEALQIAEEKVKSKGERDRYNQLNAIPENTKEREEGSFQWTIERGKNNRMGKTRGPYSQSYGLSSSHAQMYMAWNAVFKKLRSWHLVWSLHGK